MKKSEIFLPGDFHPYTDSASLWNPRIQWGGAVRERGEGIHCSRLSGARI